MNWVPGYRKITRCKVVASFSRLASPNLGSITAVRTRNDQRRKLRSRQRRSSSSSSNLSTDASHRPQPLPELRLPEPSFDSHVARSPHLHQLREAQSFESNASDTTARGMEDTNVSVVCSGSWTLFLCLPFPSPLTGRLFLSVVGSSVVLNLASGLSISVLAADGPAFFSAHALLA